MKHAPEVFPADATARCEKTGDQVRIYPTDAMLDEAIGVDSAMPLRIASGGNTCKDFSNFASRLGVAGKSGLPLGTWLTQLGKAFTRNQLDGLIEECVKGFNG